MIQNVHKKKKSNSSSEETAISTSEAREIFLSRILIERTTCHIMYNIVNIPLVNTAFRFIQIFAFNMPTINEAIVYKEIFCRSLPIYVNAIN